MQDKFKALTRRLHDFDKLGHFNQSVRDDLLDKVKDISAIFDQKMKASSDAIERYNRLNKIYERLDDRCVKAERTVETQERTIAHMAQVIKDQQNELAEQERAELEREAW